MKSSAKGVLGCLVVPLLLGWLFWGFKRLEKLDAVSIETLRGTTVQYYLTPQTEIPPAARGFHSFEIDGDGFLVQLGPSILRLTRSKPAWDAPLEPRVVTDGLEEHDAFTVDAAGAILVTRGDELYQLAASGLQRVAKMPAALEGAPSRVPGLLYLFKGPNIYLASDVEGSARRITAFAESSDSVSALCEAGDGYYVAVGHQILQIYGERKRRVIALPPGSDIVSLGCTGRPDLLFAGTPDTIYALFGTTAVPITHDFGGGCWRDGRLFALDPKRGILVGIAGIERAVGLD